MWVVNGWYQPPSSGGNETHLNAGSSVLRKVESRLDADLCTSAVDHEVYTSRSALAETELRANLFRLATRIRETLLSVLHLGRNEVVGRGIKFCELETRFLDV